MTEITPYSDKLILEDDQLDKAYPKRADTSFLSPQGRKQKEKKSVTKKIAQFFSNWSRLGMTYEEDVIKNMRAIPADKNLLPDEKQATNQDLFSALNTYIKDNATKNFYDKDFDVKREALRDLALQPELEDILDVVTNESVVYDSDYTYFCDPYIEEQELGLLKTDIRKKLLEDMANDFRRIYKMLQWKIRGWDDFKRFLIDGILAWEIVYDSLEKPTKIIGLVSVDPATLTRKFDNNKWYWVQFKGVEGRERKLLDSQIVYVSYQETQVSSRLSYLERLVRPFNIYRIIEQAQLIWTITNSSYKMMFTIPVKGMSTAAGKQAIATVMNRYRESVKFDLNSGEININGSTNLPFNKEFWMPEGDGGTPTIETIGGDGPDLNDSDQLRYFKNQLYKISKVPLNRFDQESGDTWFGVDATSVMRTEIDFGRFINRLRNQFAQILLKPLILSLAIKYPDLDQIILHSIQLQFKSYNLFEEMMEMELMQKRTEHIQSMKDALVDMDINGNEIKYFSSKFLVRKYLKMSEADMELNEKYKREEAEEQKLAGSDAGNEMLDEA